MFRTIAAPLAFAATLLLAPAAGAFTINWDNAGNVFGTNGRATVTIDSSSNPDVTATVQAGGFALNGNLFGNGVESFTAWCLDIVTTMRNGTNYEATSTPFDLAPNARILTAGQIDSIGRLFDTAFSTLVLSDNAQSAGFQLALWEIVYEKDGNPLNLGDGRFEAWGSGAAAAIAAGQAFLNNLGGPATATYALTFLQSDPHRSQNLVTATLAPVPLPAAGLLLIGALGGLAALRRRRTA